MSKTNLQLTQESGTGGSSGTTEVIEGNHGNKLPQADGTYGTLDNEQSPEEEFEEAVHGISIGKWGDYAKQWRDELWEREDTLRAEQQARDDNAYTRMVADMQKAGINPNLVQGTPNYGTNAQSTSTTDSGAGDTLNELLTNEANKIKETWNEIYQKMQELGYDTSKANNTTTNMFGLIGDIIGLVGTIIAGGKG